MRLPEPVHMDRIAVVASTRRVADVLAAVADSGFVEPEKESGSQTPVLVTQHLLSAIVGWAPSVAVERLASRLRPLGGAVARLPVPTGAEPPTLILERGATGALQPLVDIYATIPYADANPAIFAALAYIVMFGMMFGDAGHGLILLAGGIALATGRLKTFVGLRRAAPFVIGAGVTSTLFGLAYGEAFGPTGLVPTLWLAPLAQPVTLLAAAVGVGALLLAASYVLGTANRWREGGFGSALLALSGLAGSALYVGLALLGWGWFEHQSALLWAGTVLAVAGLFFGYGGLLLESGGHVAGALEAGVEIFDAVVRLGTNTISFARLAAFGLTHAALGAVIWSGTLALAHHGRLWWPVAALLFLVGNVIAFTLEALVAAIQALRLDYYELFSRVFISQGRPFHPWHVPLTVSKEN